MGMIERLKGKRVYFDTNIFIYLIEGNTQYKSVLEELAKAIAEKQFDVYSCDLVLTEILPPMVKKDNTLAIEGTIDFLCNSGSVVLASINQGTCLQAGFLRGKQGMKTPDALHVASAIEQECDVFLTNDKGIRIPEGMSRILISELWSYDW